MSLVGNVRNAWAHYLGDGVEPADPTPFEIVHDEPHAVLRRYSHPRAVGDPILLIPPLVVHVSCFDLRADQSLVAHLVARGRPVYVVDFGDITFADRRMGFEDWIDRIVPETLNRASDRHARRPVDVITWSLGGTITLLTAASHADLPLRSIAAVATPIDYGAVPYLAPLRTTRRLTNAPLLRATVRAAGGPPAWAVRSSFRITALQREITKPWFVLRNLHDPETLGRMEAVDRFIGLMPGYPGRFYDQIYTNAVQANQLAEGFLQISRNRRVELADVAQDVLVISGDTDVIAPVDCVHRAVDVLTGARSVHYEAAPGSHLGVLSGPAAAETTWRYIDEFHVRVAAAAA